MYQWLRTLTSEARQSLAFSASTNENQVAIVESRLGISLPTSYRNFVLLWDGATLCSEKIFSIQILMEYVDTECGFGLYNNELCLAADSGQTHRQIYQLKPTHFLAFGMPEHSSDLYCFDTNRMINGEYPICEFSHDEEDMERILRLECPSFIAFLQEKLYDDLELVDAFWDDTLEEEAECYFEEKSAYWNHHLKKELIAAGADMDVLPHQRWDKWRREHTD